MNFSLSLAQPDDISGIYDLLRASFDARIMRYSIYQSPLAITYLADIIATPGAKHHFVVARYGEDLLGYAHSLRSGGTFLLNYIAVAVLFRGQGVGRALLREFEKTGGAVGCDELALDVFEHNQAALDWYLHAGYECRGRSLLAHVLMPELAALPGEELHHIECDEQSALAEEGYRGFSSIKYACGNGRVTVGLINGRVCKLLAYDGVKLACAAAAIARRWASTREILLLTLPPEGSDGIPLEQTDAVLRLVRNC